MNSGSCNAGQQVGHARLAFLSPHRVPESRTRQDAIYGAILRLFRHSLGFRFFRCRTVGAHRASLRPDLAQVRGEGL